MGNGYLIRCVNCNYEYRALLGYGMLFPTVYQETVEGIKEGKFGEEYQKFFEEHPDAAVNCEAYMAICQDCGAFDTVKSMSLFLPKKSDGKTLNVGCLTFQDIKADYKIAKKYPHKCSSCGGNLKPIDLIDKLSQKAVRCPVCKGEMQLTPDLLLWD